MRQIWHLHAHKFAFSYLRCLISANTFPHSLHSTPFVFVTNLAPILFELVFPFFGMTAARRMMPFDLASTGFSSYPTRDTWRTPEPLECPLLLFKNLLFFESLTIWYMSSFPFAIVILVTIFFFVESLCPHPPWDPLCSKYRSTFW